MSTLTTIKFKTSRRPEWRGVIRYGYSNSNMLETTYLAFSNLFYGGFWHFDVFWLRLNERMNLFTVVYWLYSLSFVHVTAEKLVGNVL